MNRLLDRLINRGCWQVQQRADSRGLGRTQMRDVVDSVPVKANRFHKIDLYFVRSGDSANQVFSRPVHALGDCEDGRNVVSGMRIVRTQKCVMHIKFADRCAVRPRCPLRTKTLLRWYAKYACAIVARMAESHRASGNDWSAIDCRDRNRGVVNNAIDDLLSHLGLN